MKYTRNGREYNIPDEEIDNLVSSLEISIVDACSLWVDDREDGMSEEQKALETKASKVRRYEKAEKERKERKPKERKVNQPKKMIFALIEEAISDTVSITGRKTETELLFDYDGISYTLKLTGHRPKK